MVTVYRPVRAGANDFRRSLARIIHEQTLILEKASQLGALARGSFRLSDTLSFLIEGQNMLQKPVITGFYAF
jgi:hypothetical protein